MYLIHITNKKSLLKILKDNKIKAAKFTGNIGQGYA